MAEVCRVDIVDKYICILNEHRRNEDLKNADCVYVHMCSQGLDTHISLENYLVPLFVKCGSLSRAQQIFKRLRCPNEHSWTSLIDGYVGCGNLNHAFHLHMKMQEECVDSSVCTSLCLLKGCNQFGCIDIGMDVHGHVVKEGYDGDIFVASSLMDMYVTSGFLEEAREVFDEILIRDIAMWNVLISGYINHGLGREALLCLEKLESKGLSPSEITFVSTLKACSSIHDLKKGQTIFNEAIKKGFDGNSFIGNTLVDMFAGFGLVEEAQCVFDKLPVKDMVTWNALISGYADYGFNHEALDCFVKLNSETDLQPDSITFYSCLKACGNLGAIEMGQQLHTEIIRQELEISTYIGSAFVYMYAKFGWIEEAQEVFASLHAHDLASWNALISGYAEHGPSEEALLALELMQCEGEAPNSCTFTHCLKACSNIFSICKGQYIHTQIVATGLEKDPFIGNTLVDMYGNFGFIEEARDVFDKLSARDIVSWNAMITAYAENGLGNEGVDCYNHMKMNGFIPNGATYISKLKACGAIGSIEKGREVHVEVVEEGYVKDPSVPIASIESLHVSTALIDMYGKCGSMIDAQDVFDEMPTQHIVTWNALLSGYTSQGENIMVLELFERMRSEGVRPDDITFLSVLNACCRTGSLCKGQEYFETMSKIYGITPTIKHYNCIVDLLCRAGRIKEAMLMIENMSLQPDQVTWNIVLSSCQNWGDVDLGKETFEHTMTSECRSRSSFVLMSNICTSEIA